MSNSSVSIPTHRPLSPENYKVYLGRRRTLPLNWGALPDNWVEQQKQFYKHVGEVVMPDVINRSEALGRNVSKVDGVSKIYLMVVSGLQNGFEYAMPLASMLYSRVKIELLCVDNAMDLEPKVFNNSLILFGSRTGTTPMVLEFLNKLSSHGVWYRSCDLTDASSPLARDCSVTVPVPVFREFPAPTDADMKPSDSFTVPMRAGEHATVMCQEVAVAALIKELTPNGGLRQIAAELIEGLKWLCSAVLNYKKENTELVRAACQAMVDIGTKNVRPIFSATDMVMPLVKMFSRCFFAETTKMLPAHFPIQDPFWEYSEAMKEHSSNMVLVYAECVKNSTKENAFRVW